MFTGKLISRAVSALFIITSLLAGVLPMQTAVAAVSNTADLPAGLSADDWAQITSIQPALQAAIPSTVDYLKASNTRESDWFGEDVSLSGDTLVVGAVLEDSNATGINGDQANDLSDGSGAAYVFIRSGGVWSQQAYIKASNAGTGDYFGYSVALSGDTLVVGAPLEDGIAAGSGAAYVFTRTGTTWSEQAYLKSSNPQMNDNFGNSVALSGDTIVVGTPLEDNSAGGVNAVDADNLAPDSGASYVFTRSAGVWTQQAYLKAYDTTTATDDYFGQAVSISDDTIVVGAYGEDSDAITINGDQGNNNAINSGAAYVFTRSAGVWTQQAYIKSSNSEVIDYFGWSVSVSGDTLAVGAYGEDSDAVSINGNGANNLADSSGAVYVFIRNAGVWSQQAYVKASNANTNDQFGYALELSGDTLIVGAPTEASNATGINGDGTNNDATASGAAYIFTRAGATWSQQSYLKASNTGAGDSFGCAVALSGDTFSVGARYEGSNSTGVNGNGGNDLATYSGAAYVFSSAVVVNPPTISDITEKTTNANTATGDIAFTVGDVETPAASLIVTAASSNTTLVPNGNITHSGSGANRVINIMPASNQSGTTTITVTVNDGANTASDTFLLTVNAAQIEYTLTITSANGAVTKSPNQATYHAGDIVQLTAIPNAGWSFANWTGGLTGNANPGSVTISGNTSVTANYTLGNQAPTDILLSSNSVDENQASGSTIGALNTTDPDTGNTFTYGFCGGTDDAFFSITDNMLNTAAVFDYETGNTYSICARTTDNGGASFDKTFTISVTNVNEEVAPNGGFETYGAIKPKIPTGWKASKNFGALDGKSKTHMEGIYSVMITGSGALRKTLTQTFGLTGSGGDWFTFSFFVKGNSIPKTGKCAGQVTLYDSASATTVDTQMLTCPKKATFGFTPLTISFPASSAYDKVTIKFTYQKAGGKVWFDAVSLTR